MPSSGPAAAAAGRRASTFVGNGDDLGDSAEETTEEAFEEEQDEPHGRSKSLADDSTLASAFPNLNGDSGAAHASVAVEEGGVCNATPRRKRQRTETAAQGVKPLAVLEDSRRLFQRLWTDEDEIAILQGFLDFTSERRAAAEGTIHQDPRPFYDRIRACLRLDFNKSQLVEKLRRLKKKYRNVTSKLASGKDYAFRSPHEEAAFELSRQIWGKANYSHGGSGGDDDDVDDLAPQQNGDIEAFGAPSVPEARKPRSRGRKRSLVEATATPADGPLVLAPVDGKATQNHTSPKAMAQVPNVIQETVRSCLSPMFKELLCWAVGGRVCGGPVAGGIVEGLTLSLLPLGVGANQVKLEGAATADEKWRKQQTLELEVFSKRMDLVQEQIKFMLRELHSAR